MSTVRIPVPSVVAATAREALGYNVEDALSAAAPYIIADYLRRIVGLANGLASDEIITLLTDRADALDRGEA